MSKQSSPLPPPQTVGALLSPVAKAVTTGTIIWSREGSVSKGRLLVCTALPALDHGVIEMSIRSRAPSQPRVFYLIGGASVRSLCVNDAHPPYSGTHKHITNTQLGDEDAYEPDDIPVPPLAPRVAPGVYRAR